MVELKKEKAYNLREIITEVSIAIQRNGVDNLLSEEEMDFCIFTKEYVDVLSEGLVCYIDDYPDINELDEEEYSDFVKTNNLYNVYSGEQFEDVIGNVLSQKGAESTINDFVLALNYYRENDDFLDL